MDAQSSPEWIPPCSAEQCDEPATGVVRAQSLLGIKIHVRLCAEHLAAWEKTK